jgi:antirestriction protein
MTAALQITETPPLLPYLTDALSVLYANPYNLDAHGFYFASAEDFQAKASENVDRWGQPVEEYMIDYIDGPDADLFSACGIYQCDLELWEEIEDLEEYEKPVLFYCVDILGMTAREGMTSLEDYSVRQGTAQEYAEEYVDSIGILDSMPENLRYYLDTEAFARDMVLNGDIYEFEFNGNSYMGAR